MPLLSKPLFGLVTKGGKVIWKEDSAARFPKLRKMPRTFARGTFFFLFVGMPITCYFKAQYDYNPDSWYAKLWRGIGIYSFDISFYRTWSKDFKKVSPEEDLDRRKAEEAMPPLMRRSEKETDKLLKRLGFNM